MNDLFKHRLWIIIKSILMLMSMYALMLSLFFVLDRYRVHIKNFLQQEFVGWVLFIILILCVICLIIAVLIGIFQIIKWLFEPLGVTINFFKKYYVDDQFQGWKMIEIITPIFQFRWFTDCGYQFLYVHLGKRYWKVF